MIQFALALHYISHVDSALASTREFWRRKAGLPEEIVADPRKLSDIIAERASIEKREEAP